MSTPDAAERPARSGWHTDPHDLAIERWWTGSGWSQDTRPRTGPPIPGYVKAPADVELLPAPAPHAAPAPGRPLYIPAPSTGLAFAGVVCGLVGFWQLPWVFGPAAIILGFLAPKDRRGKRQSKAIAAIALGVVNVGIVVVAILIAMALF